MSLYIKVATDERAMVAFDLMSVDLSELAEAEILKSALRGMFTCACVYVCVYVHIRIVRT